ncbi:unnamed protein product, partial [Staurois parvus]
MISVAPAVTPVSVHQCHVSVLISATSMPHTSAHQSSELPFSVISAQSAIYQMLPIQCHPISASQCCLSVCQSVPPISASQ